MRILVTLGADRVKERQADARRRPRAEYGSRQSEDLRRPAELRVGRQWHWPPWRRQCSSLELGHRFTSTDVILDFNAAERPPGSARQSSFSDLRGEGFSGTSQIVVSGDTGGYAEWDAVFRNDATEARTAVHAVSYPVAATRADLGGAGS